MKSDTAKDEVERISEELETDRSGFLRDLQKVVGVKKNALEAERLARSSSKKPET